MSGNDLGRGHQHARELAALRADKSLLPAEEAWLADHLDYCDACAAVAAEYDAQHELFADIRAFQPEPPRDLWARTSAALEAERGNRARASGWRRLGRPRPSSLSPMPLAVVVAVVVVVGAGLLNSGAVVPGATVAGPTPIAMTNTADLQIISRDGQGNLQILSRRVDQVCPVGVSVCGAQPTFAVTSISGIQSATTLQGAFSPSGDKLVVVASGAGGEGVYVVPVRPAPTATSIASSSPSARPAASATATIPASLHPVATGHGATPSVAASVSHLPAVSPPMSSPVATAAAKASSPGASPSRGGTSSSPAAASPSTASDLATPSASPSPSEGASSPASTQAATASPSTLPSVEVSPVPEAAIQIASGVTVVDGPIYAPDGVRLAFSATPSNGPGGPDVYVWAPGDTSAKAVTNDHISRLAAWTADGILVSSVSDGTPATFLLDLATGRATPVGERGAWLPAIAPDGGSAAWWDGTVKLAADGVTWVPDSGKLVVGAWPNSGSAISQVLATGPLAAWQVRWADDGTAVAVWTDAEGRPDGGRLSLYRLDPSTKAPDLVNPMLDGAPANPDFSLRTGRLAWTVPVPGSPAPGSPAAGSPAPGSPQMVEVLAWEGNVIGRLEVPADGSGTVLP